MGENGRLEMRPVSAIPSGTRFFVPSYQRGYRWEQEQVEALLNDLLEAMRKGEESYFLQPLTLRPIEGGRIEVIDGQQRLTTLYLLKHYLAWRYREKAEIFSVLRRPPITEMPYEMDHQTRTDSREFLRRLPAGEPATVDEGFMRRAYDHIAAWAEKMEGDALTIPLDRVEGASSFQRLPGLHEWDRFLTQSVRLIWYEVDANADGRQLFLNLNRGRISLSNSELIKALLLSSIDAGLHGDPSEKEAREVEITTQWDEMEQQLHDPELWGFLGGDKRSGQGERPRMEYVFELLNPPSSGEDARNRFRTYVTYDKRIKDFRKDPDPKKPDLGTFVRETLWRAEIRGAFLRLREWYLNSEHFHKIGFLIAVDQPGCACLIEDLLRQARTSTKADFVRYLDRRVVLAVGYGTETSDGIEFDDELVDRLHYGNDTRALTHLLLLHNCLFCWQPLPGGPGAAEAATSTERYSFRQDSDRWSWSLEHVNPQSEKRFLNPNSVFDEARARHWLERHRRFLSLLRPSPDVESDLEREVRELLVQPRFREDDFQPRRDAIIRAFGRNFYESVDPVVDRVGNLALLGMRENLELGDGIFAEKRQAVLRLIAAGRFVPPCTRRLFLKAFVKPGADYFREHSFAFWTRKDADDYREEIRDYLAMLKGNLGSAAPGGEMVTTGKGGV